MSATHTDLLRHLRSVMAKQATNALSDQQLLEMFLSQRSEASFTALVQRHGPMVMGLCRRLLRHAQDAEDAFQATFLALARQAASIRRQEALSSWLHGVAYRIAERMKRTAARRATRERHTVPAASGDAMDDITWRELRSALDEELHKMPEKYRSPLVLCYLEARTQDEAARRLGWSKNTFGRRMNQARQLLAQRLTRRGLTLPAALTAPLLIDGTASATVPPLLAAATVRAGLASALGQATGELASAQVIALAEGGVGSLLAKKASGALVLLLSLTLGVGGLLAHRTIDSTTLADEPAAPKSAPSASSPRPQAAVADRDNRIEIKGRVLDPDGKPLAGAKVYVSTYTHKDKTDPKVRSESDADGRFRFMAERREVDEEAMLTAVAPGYGPDWVSLKEVPRSNELTLHLVKDDMPIKGRLLDLEGRPIAGASIRIERLRKMPGEDLAPWLKELQAKPADRDTVGEVRVRYEQILSSVSGVLGLPKSVKTGADGRFELHGLGRERVVQLHIEGPGIEYRTVSAMTRLGMGKDMPGDMHWAAFDHLAAPSKPIRGTVREKGTGKSVAGAHVNCQPAAGEGGEMAITDKEGHYEIPGIRKSPQYFINVGGLPIISQGKEATDTPGLQPVTTEFEVERGLVLRIRATEKDTGKPVRGMVQYSVCDDNRNLDRYPTYPRNVVSWSVNEKDGSFEQVVLPGRGYISFRATHENFARSRPKDKENDPFLFGLIPQPLFLGTFHSVVPINPSEKDPQSLICNIVLDSGRSLEGKVVDPEGRSLTGSMVSGLHAVMSLNLTREADATLETSSFTATGLDPRYPRGMIFYHSKKKLAKTAMVRGDEKGPLILRLEPLGAVTGRLVDAAGKPAAGIEIFPLFGEKQRNSLPAELVFANSPLHGFLFSNKTRTDKEGRFRIEGLVAGLNYDLGINRGEQFAGRVQNDITGKAGAAVDVGDIKMKELAEKDPSP